MKNPLASNNQTYNDHRDYTVVRFVDRNMCKIFPKKLRPLEISTSQSNKELPNAFDQADIYGL